MKTKIVSPKEALQVIQKAQSERGLAAIIDWSQELTPDRLKKVIAEFNETNSGFQIEFEDILVSLPVSRNEGLRIIETLCRSKAVYAIIGIKICESDSSLDEADFSFSEFLNGLNCNTICALVRCGENL